MKQYMDLLRHVKQNGDYRMDRTGVGTHAVFGHQMRFNLQEGFPAMTTKRLAWKAVVSELLWFLEGSGDERRLCEILHGTRDHDKLTIWTDNAHADYWEPKADYYGDLGRVYGKQWRSWGPRIGEPIDQIQNVINGIKKDPYGRRHIVTAWNPGEIDQMALPPCHILFQFFVSNGKLSCQMYQRSVDIFLGLPFNIASYSLLTHMVAAECGLDVGDFVWTGGDCHIYANHMDAINEQLLREPKELPTLVFEKKPFFEYSMGDFVLANYNPEKSIKAEMAK